MALRAGDKNKTVQITVTDTTLNLTTVTGVDLTTCTPAGNHVSWNWTIAASTPTTLTLQHVLDPSGADVQDPGTYTVTGTLLAPSGDREVDPPVTFAVGEAAC